MKTGGIADMNEIVRLVAKTRPLVPLERLRAKKTFQPRQFSADLPFCLGRLVMYD